MPSYFDTLAKTRTERLLRESKDDSPLPIHVDPKSGLGSGLDVIHPPDAEFGGRTFGAHDDYLPRAPVASSTEMMHRRQPGFRVDVGVQATPTCHTKFYFAENDAEQHRLETVRVPFKNAHFDVVTESEDLEYEGEGKGPNWEKYDAYRAVTYDEIVVPPGAGRVRGFFDDETKNGYTSDEERETRLAGVGGDATKKQTVLTSVEYLTEAMKVQGEISSARVSGGSVPESNETSTTSSSENKRIPSRTSRGNTGGFVWTSLGGAPAGAGAFKFDTSKPAPHCEIHPQLKEWYVNIATLRPRTKDDRAHLAKLQGTYFFPAGWQSPPSAASFLLPLIAPFTKSRPDCLVNKTETFSFPIQGACIAHVLREFEGNEFNLALAKEFDRRHEVLTELLKGKDVSLKGVNDTLASARLDLKNASDAKLALEAQLAEQTQALADANAEIESLKAEVRELAAEAKGSGSEEEE